MTKKKIDQTWFKFQNHMTREAIKTSLLTKREYGLAKDKYTATLHDDFVALSYTIRDRIVERWIKTQQRYHDDNVKRVYYLSMEFLIGRLLGNNIINLGIIKDIEGALGDLGLDLDEVREQEVDAGLGNGGLGRLAACYLDSLATLGIPAQGYGIRYEYGIFNQKIINGRQVEYPEEWLSRGNPWEFARPEYAMKVKFYGRSHAYNDPGGEVRHEWIDTEDVIAMPYDIPVTGYRNDIVNTLRLWSARGSEEFDLSYFNTGDYEQAVYNKITSENISRVLYPNDNVSQGRELRLKQEYFFTAASIADIVRRFKMENSDFRMLPDKAQIQLNETHPTLAIVELLRILIDVELLEWDAAWDIVERTFAYTNHTIMPEALERWPVDLVEKLLPRHMQLIYMINAEFLKKVAARFPGDQGKLGRMSIIDEYGPRRIRMENLCMASCHSINGVSELHTGILENGLFRDFFEFCPEKFHNVTNGITQRRWVRKANPGLAELITTTFGNHKWITDLYELRKLEPLARDKAFRKRWRDIKEENKDALSYLIYREHKIKIDPRMLFDVQVKRIHEYKRQLLFCFFIISEYLKIKAGRASEVLPRACILSGKAAPGYFMAKLIIKFINNMAGVINGDKKAHERLKVIFLENYRVSLAEKIIPAGELSEQISTAGTEACGTGCMKFMANGALTIGTLDGANVEIAEEAGKENMFIFGLTAEEINEMRAKGYHPRAYIEQSPVLQEILHLIKDDFFSEKESGIFNPILDYLYNSDHFFICPDFEPYLAAQAAVSKAYRDADDWTVKSILNTARCGKFSSDRAIREYCSHIWNI